MVFCFSFSSGRLDKTSTKAPLAQSVEQQTLNLQVHGSSPWRRTKDIAQELFQPIQTKPSSNQLNQKLARLKYKPIDSAHAITRYGKGYLC